MTNRNASHGQSHSMPDPRKNGSQSAGVNGNTDEHNLRDTDRDTTPVKATDQVSDKRPGSSQGNVSNRGGW